MIRGRDTELAAIDRLLADARRGRSGALVLRGEAGIGKSVLLDHAAAASGMQVLRGGGIETESELPFAGLHLLLARHTARFTALPPRQEQALVGALGLGPSSDGDRFLVGLAVLTVLADLAEEQPVVCLIDDAQWLDHASADALLFAGRRLEAESIAMVFAVRDAHAPAVPTPGLAEIRLGGLAPDSAADLLADRAADLPHHVRAQVLNEAYGNPLALIELSAARRDGRHHAQLPGTTLVGTHSRVQQGFADRIAGLPDRTQTLLFVAAVDDTGSAAAVLRAAERLGVSAEDLWPAEKADLVRHSGTQLIFRHPLIRAAANQIAPLGRRMAAHQALADSLDGEAHADRRAWHLAAVSTGPDETVAAALEDSAERARSLGGYAAVAAAYERAAALSADAGQRGRRLLAAAKAATDAGLLERGAALAVAAADHLDHPHDLAQAAGIRATLADEQMRVVSAHRLLAEAAASVAKTSPESADYFLMRSMDTALLDCDLALIGQSARLVTATLPAAHSSRAANYARAVLGFAGTTDDEVASGVRAFRELIERERSDPLRLREAPISQWWHEQLGDDDAAYMLAEAIVQDSRDRGAAGVLPLGLTVLARSQRHRGQHHLARASADEGLRVANDTGQTMSAVLLSNVLADLAAIEGDQDGCHDALRAMTPSRTLDSVLTACSLTLLDLGLGRYEAVLDRRSVIAAGPNRTYTLFLIPDVIEAAARLGRHDEVTNIHAFYISWAEHTGQPWARAVALRCAAQLGDPAAAEPLYVRAIQLHRQHGGRPFETARTELLYGEWLRRARRRADARIQLRSSAELFEQLSAHPWAERAHGELRASGQVVEDRVANPTPIGRLTPQELQVVRLAARGLTNRDIGAQLFLSPRTIGYHLSNAYPKLHISSRADLRTMSFESSAMIGARIRSGHVNQS